MRIDPTALLQLVNLAFQAFGKGKKVRKALEQFDEARDVLDDFISAREKIDAAEKAGSTPDLTVAENAALDAVLDKFARTAKRIGRALEE